VVTGQLAAVLVNEPPLGINGMSATIAPNGFRRTVI